MSETSDQTTKIVQAAESQRHAIFDMWRAFHIEVAKYQGVGEEDMEEFQQKARGMYEAEWRMKGGLFLLGLAQCGDRMEPAAFAHLVLASESTFFETRQKAHLRSLFVREESRRLGLGAALTRKCEEIARRHGIFRMELNVYQQNPAVDFYEKLGYAPTMKRMVRSLPPEDGEEGA